MEKRHEQTDDQAKWERNQCHSHCDGHALDNVGEKVAHF
jgi:hypothetical protein